MSRLSWAFALVAVGHLVYVPGALDPITSSTLSDLLTAALFGLAAWRSRDATGRVPASVLPILLAVAPLELLDYGLSFSAGWLSFHPGFTLVLLGALLVSGGAWKLRAGEVGAGARRLRWGAWLGAAGSAQYLVLAVEPYLFGGATYPAFLAGAALALAGWATLGLVAPEPENALVGEDASPNA